MKLLFSILLTALFAVNAFAVDAKTDSKGRTWLRLDQPPVANAVVNVEQICTPVCTGVLNGYKWATEDEVKELFNDYTQGFTEPVALSVAAQSFQASFGVYVVNGGSYTAVLQETAGYTSTKIGTYRVIGHVTATSGTVNDGSFGTYEKTPSVTVFGPIGYFLFRGEGVQPPKNCTLLADGKAYATGTVINGYVNATVPHNAECVPATSTCVDGAFSNPNIALNCTKLPAPKNCVFENEVILDTKTVPGYTSPAVPFGSICIRRISTCNDGVLSPLPLYSKCKELPKCEKPYKMVAGVLTCPKPVKEPKPPKPPKSKS